MLKSMRNRIIAGAVALVVLIAVLVTVVICNKRSKKIIAGKALIDQYYTEYIDSKKKSDKYDSYKRMCQDKEIVQLVDRYNEVKSYLTETKNKVQAEISTYYEKKFKALEKISDKEKSLDKVKSFNSTIDDLIAEVKKDPIFKKKKKNSLIAKLKKSSINMKSFYEKTNKEYQVTYDSIVNNVADSNEAINKMNELLSTIPDVEEYKDIRGKIATYIGEHSNSGKASNNSGNSANTSANNKKNSKNTAGRIEYSPNQDSNIHVYPKTADLVPTSVLEARKAQLQAQYPGFSVTLLEYPDYNCNTSWELTKPMSLSTTTTTNYLSRADNGVTYYLPQELINTGHRFVLHDGSSGIKWVDHNTNIWYCINDQGNIYEAWLLINETL